TGEGNPDQDVGAGGRDGKAELVSADGSRIDEGAGERRALEAVRRADLGSLGSGQEGRPDDDVAAEGRDREPEARLTRGRAFERGQGRAARAVEAADRSRPARAPRRADQYVAARGGDRRTEGRGRQPLAEHRLERPAGEEIGRTTVDQPDVVDRKSVVQGKR